MDDGAQNEPQIESNWPTDWDKSAQPAPDFEADQRISWFGDRAKQRLRLAAAQSVRLISIV